MQDNVDRRLDQWRAERPDLELAPMGLVARIQRAAQLLDRELRDNFAAHGLQMWEFDVLATLRRSGHPHQLTAGQLVESSMKTAGAITNRIDRLVARDLVTREVDPQNRRSVLITLTAGGLELVDSILADHVALEARLLAGLTERDQTRLSSLLRSLLLSLGDQWPANPLNTAGPAPSAGPHSKTGATP